MEILTRLLDGKQDKIDSSKHKFSRFEMNEYTILRMVCGDSNAADRDRKPS